MDSKTKKLLLLAGAGAIGLFILTRSSGQEEAKESQLVRTPTVFPPFPNDVEVGSSSAPSAPSITYNLPSFPDPAPIPSFSPGIVSPQQFFSDYNNQASYIGEGKSGSIGLSSPELSEILTTLTVLPTGQVLGSGGITTPSKKAAATTRPVQGPVTQSGLFYPKKETSRIGIGKSGGVAL